MNYTRLSFPMKSAYNSINQLTTFALVSASVPSSNSSFVTMVASAYIESLAFT